MTVNDLIKELEEIRDNGMGDYNIAVPYYDWSFYRVNLIKGYEVIGHKKTILKYSDSM